MSKWVHTWLCSIKILNPYMRMPYTECGKEREQRQRLSKTHSINQRDRIHSVCNTLRDPIEKIIDEKTARQRDPVLQLALLNLPMLLPYKSYQYMH